MHTRFVIKSSPIVLLAGLAALAILVAWQSYRPEGHRRPIAYYVLALTWSPTYCETEGRRRREPQCAASRPYAFTLHGLWPQWSKGWPEFCATSVGNYVPAGVVRSMSDIMPARRLVIHQYRKHGTCTGLAPAAYFAKARRLFENIVIPARYSGSPNKITVSAGRIRDDFLAANPSLPPGAIAISCGRHGRLRDLRLCFSKAFKPIDCGANEKPELLCSSKRITLPPVRVRTAGPDRPHRP